MRLRRILLTALAVALAAAICRAETDRPWTIALLPVQVGGAGDPEMQRLVEAVLDAELTRLPGVVVVERARIQAILDELVLSRLNRKDLQAGQIVGAEVLLAARLTHEAERVDLVLTAIETATGNILLSQSCAAADNPAIREAARRFMEALPASLVRREHVIDVAVLPITHTSPFPEQGGVAESLRGRLAERLATLPGVRVLHRELGEFVLAEASLAATGLVAPERTFAPVAGAIAVHGNLTQTFPSSKEVDQSQLVLELKVSRGGEEKEIRVSGILAEAAAMETEAVQRLAEAIAALAGTPAPPAVETDDQARRYWEAQKYLALAKQMTATYEGLQANAEQAISLALKAANLIPDSPEPYVVVDPLGTATRDTGEGFSVLLYHEEPIVTMRRHFIEAFPDHPLWGNAVRCEISHLKNRFGCSEQLVEANRVRALDLARRVAHMILNCPPGPDCGGTAVDILLENGDANLAQQVCLAYVDEHEPPSYTPFGYYIAKAIYLERFDWAWEALEWSDRMYPGWAFTSYYLTTTLRDNVKKAGPRFKPFLEHIEWLLQQKRDIEAFQAAFSAPSWGDTRLVDRKPLEGLTQYTVPQGHAMSVSAEGGPLLAILRSGQEYWLWEVSRREPLRLEGVPPLYPLNTIYTSYVMRPSIASFGGRVYVGAEEHGLYVVDLATGKATKVTDGFPDGSVHALLVRGGALYAAGGGKEAGYIARLGDGSDKWTLWMAPDACGPVRRVCPRDGEPWRVYHSGSERISLFDPASGAWRDGWSVEVHSFQPSCIASTCGLDVLVETYSDTQDPLYRLEESSGGLAPIYFPPSTLNNLSSTLGRHRWFWDPKTREGMRVAPLAGCPTDVLADEKVLWVLDRSGGLTATRDGATFAGPFMVADRASSMCRTHDAICVNVGDSLVIVPLKTLRAGLQERGAFQSSEQILRTALERLEAWTGKQPPLPRVFYFSKVGRRDLAVAAYRDAVNKGELCGSIHTARMMAYWLYAMHAFEEARELLRPFAEEPSRLKCPVAEDVYLCILREMGRWDEVVALVPRLWREAPLRVRGATKRVEYYFRALRQTASKDVFEKTLWAYVTGDLPEVPNHWRETLLFKRVSIDVRREAAKILKDHLRKEDRLDEIQANPLLAGSGD